MDSEQAYRVLGLGSGATARDAKLAYRRKALEHHPDRFESSGDKEYHARRFREARDAYEALRDSGFPELREEPVPEPDFSPKVAGRRFEAREQDETGLGEKLGLGFSVNIGSLVLWGLVIPGAAAVILYIFHSMLAAVRPQ